MPSGGSERISERGLEPTTAWAEEMAEQAGELWEPWLPWLGAAMPQPLPCCVTPPPSTPEDMGPEVAGSAPVAVKRGVQWDSTY